MIKHLVKSMTQYMGMDEEKDYDELCKLMAENIASLLNSGFQIHSSNITIDTKKDGGKLYRGVIFYGFIASDAI